MIGLIFWASAALVAYVYAGYPTLVTLVARTRPTPRFPAAPLPKVTLIIAAYDDETEILPGILPKACQSCLGASHREDCLWCGPPNYRMYDPYPEECL